MLLFIGWSSKSDVISVEMWHGVVFPLTLVRLWNPTFIMTFLCCIVLNAIIPRRPVIKKRIIPPRCRTVLHLCVVNLTGNEVHSYAAENAEWGSRTGTPPNEPTASAVVKKIDMRREVERLTTLWSGGEDVDPISPHFPPICCGSRASYQRGSSARPGSPSLYCQCGFKSDICPGGEGQSEALSPDSCSALPKAL